MSTAASGTAPDGRAVSEAGGSTTPGRRSRSGSPAATAGATPPITAHDTVNDTATASDTARSDRYSGPIVSMARMWDRGKDRMIRLDTARDGTPADHRTLDVAL
ncbi:hypothetical protein, partial [Streptomyces clavuligerus]|uniref:hypothetical protein n=1 Tax=Streptomyces clavuligerus TaxID=1901 RepID=UPI003F6888D5